MLCLLALLENVAERHGTNSTPSSHHLVDEIRNRPLYFCITVVCHEPIKGGAALYYQFVHPAAFIAGGQSASARVTKWYPSYTNRGLF